MKLRFNDVVEFMNELHARPPSDGIVRVTQRFTSGETTMPLQRVHVVATYGRDTDAGPCVVMLERYCGDAWPDVHGPNPAIDKAEKLVVELSTKLASLHFTVGAGVLEP